MGRHQYWAGRVYDLCVYYMTGTPEGSTESGFMEKPAIEPWTPGLQGIALIHYTTGASLVCIFVNIYENIKNVIHKWGYMYKINIISAAFSHRFLKFVLI